MTRRLLLGCVYVLLLGAQAAAAQGVRGSVSALGRRIDIRKIALDSVAANLVIIGADSIPRYQGFRVNCAGGPSCTFYRPGDQAAAWFITQDLDVSAWGLGAPGLSATVLLRTRQAPNSDFEWPRSGDAFDAILAYAEWNRERYRLRAGRQRITSGLGFTGFDGIEAQWLPNQRLRFELFGGRSLARGLEDARNTALEAIEDFLPDQAAYLFGGAARVQGARAALGLQYQREIWSDRHGLISERAALDARTAWLAPVELEAAADYDFAFGHIGKAHVTAHWMGGAVPLTIDATVRRYVPYFELWTIWGFFSPVAYHEAEIQAGWRLSQKSVLSGGIGYRQYGDTDAPVVFDPLEDDVLRVQLRGRHELTPAIGLDAEYRLDRGFGAFLSSGSLGATWMPAPRWRTELHASASQQILEFRFGEGAVVGAGASAETDVHSNLTLSAGVELYRQLFQNRPTAVDWNQTRAFFGARFDFGRDPGLEPAR